MQFYKLIVMLCCLSFSFSVLSEEWELKKEKNDIRVFTKKVDPSKLMSFRGEAVLETDMEYLIGLMQDVPGLARWLHTCYEPVLIKNIDDKTRLVHMKIATPTVVIAERDLVETVHMDWVNENEFLVQLNGVPDQLDPLEGFVRMPLFRGTWRFTRIDDKSVKVVYEGLADPGGQVPASVTNLVVIDAPFKSLSNLKDMVADRKHQAKL